MSKRDPFFLVASAAMLVIVLAGFAPTLTLRPLFDAPAIPAYLYVHGFTLTAWYVLLFAQAVLIASGRVSVHRQLGISTITVGVFVLATGLMATLDGPSRLPNLAPETVSTETLTMVTGLAVSNILSLVLFSLALTGAVIWRSRPDRHKRLVIWASLFVLGPAVGRISRWPIFGDIAEPAFVAIWMLSVVIAILGYEFWTLRRPHPMTLTSIAALIVVGFGLGSVGSTEVVREWVRGLF